MTSVIRAWESFLEGNPAPAGVRDEVLLSWRRSRWSGVDPDRPDLPEIPVASDSRFQRTAAPVLESIAEPLVGDRTAMHLLDPDGVVMWRWVTDAQLARELDAADARVGVRWAEDAVGTSGGGTTVETDRPATVVGAEHFATKLHGWACSAAPVVHPLTRRVCGIVNVSVRAADANPHLPLVVRSMVAAVTVELRNQAGAQQRRLLETYLAWRHRTRKPLVAVDDRIAISDEIAVEHDDLWDRLVAAGPLATAIDIDALTFARIHPVTPGTLADGAVLVVDPSPDAATATPAVAPTDDPWTPLERAERDVIVAALDRHGGNKSRAADEIGLSRRALYDKLARYRIRR